MEKLEPFPSQYHFLLSLIMLPSIRNKQIVLISCLKLPVIINLKLYWLQDLKNFKNFKN